MPIRSAERLRLALGMLLSCSALGCTPEPREVSLPAYPSAGLYTPGSALGASDPTDVPMTTTMGRGNRCVPLVNMPSTFSMGTLHVDYTTQTQHGRYAPKNCEAAWIETSNGQYVATLEVRAALRRPGLVYWQDHACTEKLGPDAVTSATLPDHKKPHAIMWSGVDVGSNPVPDGSYKLFIEVTESDKEPGELTSFDFDKGSTSTSVEAPVAFDGPLLQVTIAWASMPGGRPGGAAGAH